MQHIIKINTIAFALKIASLSTKILCCWNSLSVVWIVSRRDSDVLISCPYHRTSSNWYNYPSDIHCIYTENLFCHLMSVCITSPIPTKIVYDGKQTKADRVSTVLRIDFWFRLWRAEYHSDGSLGDELLCDCDRNRNFH